MAFVKNIIRKQTVHFQYNGQADGFALQKEVGDWCRDVLLPQLERQLEPYCRPDVYISLDKLDLAAQVGEVNWQEQVQKQLSAAIAQQLANIPIVPLSDATTVSPSTSKGKLAAALLAAHVDNPHHNEVGKPLHVLDPLEAVGKAHNQQETQLQQQTAATVEAANKAATRKTDDLVLFFLIHGHLPWWSSALTNTAAFPQLLNQWIFSYKTAERAGALLQQLRQNLSSNLVQRILNHLPGHSVFQFVQNIIPDAKPQLAAMESFFTSFFQPIGKVIPKSASQQLYRQWLTDTLQAAQVPSIPQILEIWYIAIEKETNQEMADEIFQRSATLPKDNPVAKAWQQLLKQKQAAPIVAPAQAAQAKPIEPVDKRAKRPQQAGRKEPTTAKKVTAENKSSSPTKLNEPSLATKSKEPSSPTKSKELSLPIKSKEPLLTAKAKAVAIELEGGVFIENAGAVIVAPFLPALFAKLKLAKEGSLLKPDMAALLVQYIVSGSKTINEAQLLLPKILCGMEPDAPIDTNKKITARQKKEVAALMASVVEHWAVLKNTSVQGLREAFLQRNGKITFFNNQWLLQVEQKSFDMLLQQLPWNIGMIKLAWMKNMLRTEWV